MPKKNQKVALKEDQFASLLASVLPAGMQLDASVLAALEQATNQQLNQVLDKKAAKASQLQQEAPAGQENKQNQ